MVLNCELAANQLIAQYMVAMMIDLPFNPINVAQEIEKVVVQGTRRKYYRFRAAPYYGGNATADAVGCCFLCAYCWNYLKILKPQNYGKYFSSQVVASNLLKIVRKRRFKLCRITGCEPILGESSLAHLIEVITRVLDEEKELRFILETNGLFLGLQPDLVTTLKIPRLSIRVALKGWDELSFQNITGADGRYFEYPLRGLKKMLEEGLNAWPAVMRDTFGETGIERLKVKLSSIGISTEIEVEALERYPYVLENLGKRDVALTQ